MKLLTWMHRKFKQGSTETHREFPIGHPLLDEPHFYQHQSHANGTWGHVHRSDQARRSFANIQRKKLKNFQENASVDFSELFEGFLAIGTLGTEASITEPQTPTFSMSFEKLAQGQTEFPENELRLLNDELERVLATEAKEDGWTDSSSRNSHVSNGRVSHASTITLSGKPLEIPESADNENLNCPLQEYLLGSTTVELPEKAMVQKKENRTSLGELIEKHKTEEISETKHKKKDKREDKEGEKTATNVMKKILKKKMASAVSKNSSETTRGTKSTATETKLFKIMHKFQRKVHPECLTSSTRKPEKPYKIGLKNIIPCNIGYYKDKHALDESSTVSQRARRTGHIRVSNSHSSSSQFAVVENVSNGSMGCWIKTDEDYLVLELWTSDAAMMIP